MVDRTVMHQKIEVSKLYVAAKTDKRIGHIPSSSVVITILSCHHKAYKEHHIISRFRL